MSKSSIISLELITMIQAQVPIDWLGRHGIKHWARVYEIGMKLAEQTGVTRDQRMIAWAYRQSVNGDIPDTVFGGIEKMCIRSVPASLDYQGSN